MRIDAINWQFKNDSASKNSTISNIIKNSFSFIDAETVFSQKNGNSKISLFFKDKIYTYMYICKESKWNLPTLYLEGNSETIFLPAVLGVDQADKVIRKD